MRVTANKSSIINRFECAQQILHDKMIIGGAYMRRKTWSSLIKYWFLPVRHHVIT